MLKVEQRIFFPELVVSDIPFTLLMLKTQNKESGESEKDEIMGGAELNLSYEPVFTCMKPIQLFSLRNGRVMRK